ncbi:MAG: radical SAM protein [Candidatus Bathyarchaeota archaeon]|nr:MAG: radical SAM protein [Candidatus Bathyarchaeota archaeon]
MRTHVTLVNPPLPRGSYQHPPLPSLGLGYLAAVLEKNQHEVDLIDFQTTSVTLEEFRNEISRRQPDIVGITSVILSYKSALQIAEIAKEVSSKCLTVVGGHFVSFWDEKALQECASLDIVARKEGEYTLLELAERVKAGKDYHDVLGITCRKDGEIVRNPDRPYIENLDELPFPARHLWPIEAFQRYGTFFLLTSRGCVQWCNFCIEVRMDGRKCRMRSPRNVVDELEFLHNTYGAEYFVFLDDAFTLNKRRVEEICQTIKNRKLKIKWGCETRVDMVTKELLLKMKEAGCVAVWFGIESGSQRVLNAMGKGISLAQTIRAFKWAKEVGLKPNPNIVLGFPGETKKTAWETIKFVKRLVPDYMSCYTVATPYPGTPMYDLVKEKGWLKITDFDKYDTATPTFETPWLSMKELERIYEQVFKSYYLDPTHVLRMFAKGGTYTLSATRRAFADLLIAIRSKLQRNNPRVFVKT